MATETPLVGIHQVGVDADRRIAFRGDRQVVDYHDVVLDANNVDPGAVNYHSLTITSNTAGQHVIFAVNGITFDYTLPSGLADATAAAAWVFGQIMDDIGKRGNWQAIYNASGAVLYFVAPYYGTENAITLTATTNCTAAQVQAAADPAALPFGCWAVQIAVSPNSIRENPLLPARLQRTPLGTRNVTLPSDSHTKKTITIVAAGTDDAKAVTLGVRVGKRVYQTSFTTGASAALSAVAAEAAIEAVPGVTSSVSSATITAQPDTAGEDIEIWVNTNASSMTFTITESAGVVLERDLLGIVERTFGPNESKTLGSAASGILPNTGGQIVGRGIVAVPWTESTLPARTDTVYVGTASGERGLTFKSAASGRVALSKDRAQFLDGGSVAEGIVFVYVNPVVA